MARILVVDDYEPILDMLRLVLAAAGHEVFTAGDGISGLSQAQSLRPDLVLLDIDMPETDGVFVCREIKQAPSTAEIPVLLMTGRPGSHARARGAGALGILSKPFACSELLTEIKRVTGRG